MEKNRRSLTKNLHGKLPEKKKEKTKNNTRLVVRRNSSSRKTVNVPLCSSISSLKAKEEEGSM